MIKRISLLGAALAVIILVVQFLLRDRAAVEQPRRLESPRQELPAVDPTPAPPPPRAEPANPAPLEAVARAAADPELPPDARRFAFECADGVVFAVRIAGDEAALFPPDSFSSGTSIVLTQTPAASGARYASGATVFWSKGEVATLEIDGKTYADCASSPSRVLDGEARRRGATFRALGNEPSWVLEITHDRIELATELGTRRIDFPYREPTSAGALTTYRSFAGTQELVLVIDRIPCNDSMSGELFDNTVAVTCDGEWYYGCGRFITYR